MHLLSDKKQDFVHLYLDTFRLTRLAIFKTGLPLMIFSLFLYAFAILFLRTIDQVPEGSDGELWALLILIVPAPIALLLFNSTLIQVEALAHGNPETLIGSVKQGFRLYILSLVGSVLFMFATGFGFLMLFIPGMYLFVLLSFWWINLLTGETELMGAFRSSRLLVKNNWWRTAISLGQVFGVFLIVSWPINQLKDLAIEMFPLSAAMVLVALLLGIQITCCSVYFCAMMVVSKNDLELRREA